MDTSKLNKMIEMANKIDDMETGRRVKPVSILLVPSHSYHREMVRFKAWDTSIVRQYIGNDKSKSLDEKIQERVPANYKNCYWDSGRRLNGTRYSWTWRGTRSYSGDNYGYDYRNERNPEPLCDSLTFDY